LRGANATKQSILPLRGEMDRFASLAMTTVHHRVTFFTPEYPFRKLYPIEKQFYRTRFPGRTTDE